MKYLVLILVQNWVIWKMQSGRKWLLLRSLPLPWAYCLLLPKYKRFRESKRACPLEKAVVSTQQSDLKGSLKNDHNRSKAYPMRPSGRRFKDLQTYKNTRWKEVMRRRFPLSRLHREVLAFKRNNRRRSK